MTTTPLDSTVNSKWRNGVKDNRHFITISEFNEKCQNTFFSAAEAAIMMPLISTIILKSKTPEYYNIMCHQIHFWFIVLCQFPTAGSIGVWFTFSNIQKKHFASSLDGTEALVACFAHKLRLRRYIFFSLKRAR